MFFGVDQFRNIRITDKVAIKKRFLPPSKFGIIPVHSLFVDYIKECGNSFTVIGLMPIDDKNAYIKIYEVVLTLEYFQVVLINNRSRIINSVG